MKTIQFKNTQINFTRLNKDSAALIAEFFFSVFSASEGADEGQAVSELAADLTASIDDISICGFVALEGQHILAAVLFSRLDYDNKRSVMMLSPMAVATETQGKGVGQALINYALTELKQQQVDVVVSYGDPAFYTKVGFQQVEESTLRSPMPLSMPQGWIAQSLTQQPIPSFTNKPNCVQQFVNPDLW